MSEDALDHAAQVIGEAISGSLDDRGQRRLADALLLFWLTVGCTEA